MPRLTAALGESFGPAKRFWEGSGPEWDVVAASERKGAHLLAEVKWSTRPATADSLQAAYAELLERGVPPFAQGRIVRALFVPLLPRRRPKSLPHDVRLIDAATLLAAGADDGQPAP